MNLIVARCLALNNKSEWISRAILTVAFLVPNVLFAESKDRDDVRPSSTQASVGVTTEQEGDSTDAQLRAEQVWHGGRWLDIEEFNESQMTPLMKRYFQERGDGVLDIEGHRRMANWTDDHGMKPQSHAHWFGVLTISPNDDVARAKLQFERVNGEWLTKEEINQAGSASKEQLKQTKSWMPKMKEWANSLLGSDTKNKIAALEALKNLNEPSAVVALQLTSLQLPDDVAVPFVNAIKNVRAKEACDALVNVAIADPSSKRGQAAIVALKAYPMVFYVPELIESLSTDIELRHRVFTRPSGEKVIRQVQMKETRDLEQVSVLDIVVQGDRTVDLSRQRALGRNRGVRSMNMVARAEKNGAAQLIASRDAEREIDRNKVATNELNLQNKVKRDRILDVLRGCSGESLDSNLAAWWVWWDQKNEEVRTGDKGYAVSYAEDRRNTIYTIEVKYADALPRIASSRCECLIRGTLIQTEYGLRAIETIRTGDLVLAQDVERGTLALKPVLNTTLRPPAKTLRFTTKAGSIQTTLGHYWWVEGCGWLRSKELEVGMPLHVAKGTMAIESIVEVNEEVETFNLVVADYHTYFVGPERILSNDATELRPTLQAIPGSPVLVKSLVSK